MIRKSIVITAMVILVLALFLPFDTASSAPVSIASAYDVIAAVNALRTANGLSTLEVDGSLMASAQSHSDYQASIGTWTHEGADGSRPRDRAAAAGYGGGATIYVSENVAEMVESADLNYLIYTIWSDAIHWNTMVNPSYVHAGAGVAQSIDGLVYYTLDVGYYSGASSSTTSSTYSTSAPSSLSATSTDVNLIVPVMTSTPQPDGSTIHTVDQGQALWAIAIAYGITINDIIALNGLDSTNPVVWVGDDLIIRPSSTAGPTVESATSTPTATRTQRATSTPRPPTSTPTITFTPPQTPRVILALPKWEDVNKRILGIIIIAASALGLAAVVVAGFRPSHK